MGCSPVCGQPRSKRQRRRCLFSQLPVRRTEPPRLPRFRSLTPIVAHRPPGFIGAWPWRFAGGSRITTSAALDLTGGSGDLPSRSWRHLIPAVPLNLTNPDSERQYSTAMEPRVPPWKHQASADAAAMLRRARSQAPIHDKGPCGNCPNRRRHRPPPMAPVVLQRSNRPRVANTPRASIRHHPVSSRCGFQRFTA
jgi:hypothetical protein